MKIKIEFDTEVGDDFIDYKIHIQAPDMAIALFNINQLFRNKLKYGTCDNYDEIEKLQEEFLDIISNCNLNNILN